MKSRRFRDRYRHWERTQRSTPHHRGSKIQVHSDRPLPKQGGPGDHPSDPPTDGTPKEDNPYHHQ